MTATVGIRREMSNSRALLLASAAVSFLFTRCRQQRPQDLWPRLSRSRQGTRPGRRRPRASSAKPHGAHATVSSGLTNPAAAPQSAVPLSVCKRFCVGPVTVGASSQGDAFRHCTTAYKTRAIRRRSALSAASGGSLVAESSFGRRTWEEVCPGSNRWPRPPRLSFISCRVELGGRGR